MKHNHFVHDYCTIYITDETHLCSPWNAPHTTPFMSMVNSSINLKDALEPLSSYQAFYQAKKNVKHATTNETNIFKVIRA